ncbi:MAG TPA: tripartite tricarboxylate transporter substrate binding protein [Pseudolabrys sp.]|nr:tripartite tricarboxylate transporter substrate binding protein [Pseudolabrys sp.]
MSTIRNILIGAALVLAPLSSACAQAFPDKTVTIVNPFTAGSVSDLLARVLAEKLSAKWKQTVLVDNKPGIAGTIYAAKAAPDGYTLISTSNGHTILSALNKDLPFDPIKGFSGITQIASVPVVMIVTPELPPKNLKELIALAKEKPGTLNFTSAGLASSNYIAGELFKQTAGVDIVHVPFRGTPEQLTSIMRGDSQLSLAFLGNAVPFITSGKVRALAIASAKRNPALPDVPTFAEAGMPQYQYDSWFGIMAPAGTPAPVLKKIHNDIAEIIKLPDVQTRWQRIGAVAVVSNTPAEFDTVIRADADRYGKLLRAAGIMPK